MNKKLYPVVTYFNQDFENEVRGLQSELFEITGARASLDEWRPHVTVGKALWIEDGELQKLVQDLNDFTQTQSVFEMEFDGFGYMDDWAGAEAFNCEPYVVYVDVVVSNDLKNYVEKLGKILDKYEHRYVIHKDNFHMTLAFKDLNRTGFEKAKKYLRGKSFNGKVRVDSLSVVLDTEKGDVIKEVVNFKFGKKV
ncbi:MAG: 2'-5' RNA ligase family protein [Patescibacteria group bacterium]